MLQILVIKLEFSELNITGNNSICSGKESENRSNLYLQEKIIAFNETII